MKQNDFLVALFGRPVWFHCKRCNRVQVADTEDEAKETWEEEQTAMSRCQVSAQDMWWFDTVCEPCQIQPRS
ncbi:MAG: hypothetical protein LZF62_300058 [Nitrospira sp.]|nr:MAG: hypothetical protein LZF62_300058 [Nitrospira sp.]